MFASNENTEITFKNLFIIREGQVPKKGHKESQRNRCYPKQASPKCMLKRERAATIGNAATHQSLIYILYHQPHQSSSFMNIKSIVSKLGLGCNMNPNSTSLVTT